MAPQECSDQRAETRFSSWPSYLDNTVAGGISAGSTPYSSIVRECAEEASLPASFVENNIKMTSVVVYNYRTTGGWLQPEVQYVYDLEMPRPSGMDGDDVVKPKTNAADGEVESFQLMDVEEVVQRMCDGDFKPNCALVSRGVFFFLPRDPKVCPKSSLLTKDFFFPPFFSQPSLYPCLSRSLPISIPSSRSSSISSFVTAI